MAIKRIRSKRKNHVTELDGMAKLFLYRDIREHLDNGAPLSTNNQNTLHELGTTAEKFCAEWLAEAEKHQQERFLQWVEDAATRYRECPCDFTRQKLVEALERVDMDPNQYIYDNFEKYRPVDLSEYKQRKRI